MDRAVAELGHYCCGRCLVAQAVLTAYHVMRKRKAAAGRTKAEPDDMDDPLWP
ncbi:hypothetical protein [Cupriavidus sp. D39]|uniref:hypothetical protein n=1 Tax=Cupriavidus sp. D39 TaxID=2997877 RepID=UPI0022708100|nr:hypothetical protein [Cupriavidus sp. D39]MCY0856864.1 hypothetical protein [Cupriavidus sp. D39]